MRPRTFSIARRPLVTLVALLLILCFLLLPHYRSSYREAGPFASWFTNTGASPYYSEDSSSRYYSWKTKSFFPPFKDELRKDTHTSDLCAGFPTPLLDKVQVILKTGIGEKPKTQAHLKTLSSCLTNLLIFSDLEDQIDSHRVIDVLADLPASYQDDNADFAAYVAQKETKATGEDVGYSGAGWKLDRFKFLPMIDKAHELRPNASWYAFLETDVYYFWDTLFRLLDQLEPDRMHFLGSPAPGSHGRWFPYGGAGFVISNGLMKRLHVDGLSLAVEFEEWIKNDCCGDAVLGYAILNKTGVRLEALYPTFSGDEVRALRVDKERWCIPLLSLHRISPEQMESLWNWERSRAFDEEPLTHSTLLSYTHSHLRDGPSREFWDDYSDAFQPEQSPAHDSASACATACSTDPDCLQYSFSDQTCRFADFIKQGKPVDDDEKEFVSGWDVDKLAKLGFKVGGSGVCKEATWMRPDIR